MVDNTPAEKSMHYKSIGDTDKPKTHSIFVYADDKYVGRKDLAGEINPYSLGDRTFINTAAQEMLMHRGIPWLKARVELKELAPKTTFHMCNKFLEDKINQ